MNRYFHGTVQKRIEKINDKLLVNPNGYEWLRAKGSYPVPKYCKYSETLMKWYQLIMT
ncbi:DUF1972 domain-containing protein [Enterococcus faecium]|uniref:DUF1972 domain-containing protein n=1 Tax=Enterococcus faecium TaxID=1352 RepID=UPI0009AE5DBF|nr:DUF1972 domain-containing protein [Enterococcus faecium]EGP5093930.1 DUF1972 domain-containing protein [Enterococcus faecium]EGP5119299.1 DUF1972 domain-containing protein [Enterococcus faecium]EHQ3681974.1 DUF1972 domain-containing protein [Enterococcus faecium]MBD9781143.1 DUF1972 domain-containing protein [Enterococcus faecium]MBJ1658058.1 DUF1972 domain-containing protein [Enterococcus faecium]